MNPVDTALLAGLLLAFGLVSKRLDGSVVTAPMVAVTAGWLLGPGLGLLEFELGEGALHVLAELTLAFVLFGDATRIDISLLRQGLALPSRMLALGLPLSILLGTVVAKLLLPELHVWEAATLGAVLAPTDAALGQAVVASPSVPIRIRQALNVESGLNDGIALPFVLVFASLASMGESSTRTLEGWILFAAFQVILGPLVGFAVAFIGGKLIGRAIQFGFVEDSFERLGGLALALLCFAGAELVGGNGFISCFVGGLTLGATQQGRCQWMLDFLEAEGTLLMLFVFLGLGTSFAAPALEAANPQIILYALASLTLVRMVPISLSVLGMRLKAPTHIFLGWFGPRGLATLLYGILIVSEASLPNEEMVFTVLIVTTLLSVFVHGLTAAPGAQAYARLAAQPSECPAEHSEDVPHIPIRRASLRR